MSIHLGASINHSTLTCRGYFAACGRYALYPYCLFYTSLPPETMTSSASLRQTLSTDLVACLGQGGMTDMTFTYLEQTVGRFQHFGPFLLAVRRMLLGSFTESASKVVKLGYSSKVLRAVVEFCFTDNVVLFDGRVEITAAQEMVQLIACAHFLNIHLLEHWRALCCRRIKS